MNGKGRILIVEDDNNTLAGLVEILSQEGYDVRGVANPWKALEILKERDFHVLLTDLKMPGINGLDLSRKATLLVPNLKTVVMTAYSSILDEAGESASSFYRCLIKPLNIDLLLRVLKEAIDEMRFTTKPS